MKMEKKLIIVTLILLSLFMIGAVSAASNTTETSVNSDVSNDEKVSHTDSTTDTSSENVVKKSTDTISEKKTISTNEKEEDDKLSSKADNEVLKETDNGTFSTLQNKINSNSIIELNNSYEYDDGFNPSGITIDSKTVTIHGNGYKLDGKGQGRIFQVINNGHLIIENLQLINGQGQNDGQYGGNVGGAIYNNGKLTIINCTFTNNTAEYRGGAIYAGYYSTVNINNTNFTHNTAKGTLGDGGAIYAATSSTVNINNNTFTQNTANYGGAIYAEQYSTVNINNTKFTQNNVDWYGGAIFAHQGFTVNINNTTFTQNNATYGGAIYSYLGTVIIMGSELTDNTERVRAGAISNYGTLTLVDSNLQNDGLSIWSSGYLDVVHIGGDIAFVTTQVFDISVLPAVDVDLVEIQLSNGDGYTGEVWVNVTNSTFNQIVKVKLKNGKGSGTINLPIGNKYNATINTIQGTSINPQTQEFTTIHETSFTALYNNITNSQDDTLTLTHDYIYDNRTDTNLKTGIPINKTITINGNGHTINGSNEARIFKVTNGVQLRLINITLTKGKGQDDGPYGDIVGGAIYAMDNCNITITDSKITHNNAKYGGAIYTSNSHINITHTNINNNNATWCGGAIIAYNSHINITHTNITYNNANNGHGGAIYADDNSQININNTNINNNNANNDGGAIYTWNSQININNTNINQNNAKWGSGGAIYSDDNSQVNISYTSFIKNTAEGTDTYYGGGAIYAYADSIMVVSSSLFMENTASNTGGAIYGGNFKKLTVNNNIFLNNGNKEIYLYKYDADFDYDLGCNWFGNNASNYEDLIKDDIVGISGATLKFDSWLFLTANSTPVTALSGGNVTFKLSLYNSSKSENNVSDFDNGLLYPVDLTVSYVNGTGDESVRLGGNVGFKPDTVGIGSVTANISNVGYTIGLTIDKEVYGTEITDLSFNDLFEGKPVTVNGTLKYDGTNVLANQKINVTISNNTYIISQYGYTDSNGKFSITLIPAINGDVNITATYQGNETDTKITYNATNATTTTNIAKVTYNITFDKLEPSYDYNTTITITSKVTTNYKELDVTNVTITLNNGNKEVVNLINGNFTYTFQGTIGGLNNITVTCKDTTNTTQAFIKYPTQFTITVTNSTTNKPITITVTETNNFTGNITVSIGESNYTVTLTDGEGISTPIPLAQGNYNAAIDYAGNLTYNATTATSNPFTIKYPTKFTIQKIPDITEGTSINLIVNEENKYTGPVIIIIGSEKYTVTLTDGFGKTSINNLKPGTYTAIINFPGNDEYENASANSNSFKVNSKPSPTPSKISTKIVAKQKNFKLSNKNKKYTITLKDKNNKAIKNVKVTLKVKGKTYNARTNSKGKATFKLTKLNKKGTYKAVIKYNGNKKYKKSSKKVKITIQFQNIGKNSKNKALVKKIQKSLKQK